MRDPHIWDDEPKKAKVAELKKAIGAVPAPLKRMANKVVDHMANARVLANSMANETTPDESGGDEIREGSRRPAGGVVSGTRPLLSGEVIGDGDLTAKAGHEGLSSRVRSSTYKYRDQDRRRAYQREYMKRARVNKNCKCEG